MEEAHDSAGKRAEPPSAASVADRFHNRLVVFALRRLGEKAAAEDAAQETLRRVIEALEQDAVRNLDALPGFVLTTAKHVCQQRLRSRGREAQAMERLAGEPPVVLASAYDQLVSDERRRAVRNAMNSLPSDDRQVLQFFYMQGLDAGSVARQLRISAGAARVRKHRALKRLAGALGDDETFRPLRELE